MPELPEVETTRRGIVPLIVGKKVASVVIHNASLRWPIPKTLAEVLPGQSVRNVGRRSKYLLIGFERGTLIVHLGMTGHLRVADQTAERRKHDHVEIQFTDGKVLRFNDSRRFGAMIWTTDNPLLHARLAELGPEPFADEFNKDYLYKQARNRSVAIKPFLMDAKVVVGVGNIYASEALFRAGIDPRKPAGKVSRTAYSRLVDAVRAVLEESIAAGGTTIRDFTDSNGKPGYFKQALQVYGRTEQPCIRCHAPIRQIRLGQRSTYFCSKCQK
jgi:formamidopyrimidine-DNA glycosylase